MRIDTSDKQHVDLVIKCKVTIDGNSAPNSTIMADDRFGYIQYIDATPRGTPVIHRATKENTDSFITYIQYGRVVITPPIGMTYEEFKTIIGDEYDEDITPIKTNLTHNQIVLQALKQQENIRPEVIKDLEESMEKYKEIWIELAKDD